MTMSSRERVLAAIAGLAAVGAIVYLTVDRWAVPKWKRTQAAIKKATDTVDILRDIEETKQTKAAIYEAQVARALRYETPRDAERMFVQKLNALRRAAGMARPPTIDALSAKHQKHFTLIEFTFKVRCTLEELTAFLDRFYADQKGQRIDSITINPFGRYRKPDDPLQVTMRITAVVIPPGDTKDETGKPGT